MQDKFKVKLSDLEIYLVEALIPYYLNQRKGLGGGMKRAELVEYINGSLGFPLSPRYVKEKLKECKEKSAIYFEGGVWRITEFFFRTFKHELNVDYITSIRKGCAAELEMHKKAYLGWKYEQELKQTRIEALGKVAQSPENMNMMATLEHYMARHKDQEEYCFTTPEAQKTVIEEQCWMVNPAGFILKPEPGNPISWMVDDQSHVEGYIGNEDFWNLKRLSKNPKVRMWKKILPEAPVFYLPAVYAVQNMMANPLRPMCMENHGALAEFLYLRWNGERKCLEYSVPHVEDGWGTYDPPSSFFTKLFRDCTVTELSKYFPGYEPQDDASDDY